MNYPPKIDVGKLDFSEFHPLDHVPGSDRCLEFYPHKSRYRNARYCLSMYWDFKWRDDLKAKTLCKVGWHHSTTMFYPKKQIMSAICSHCWKRLGPDQPMDQL